MGSQPPFPKEEKPTGTGACAVRFFEFDGGRRVADERRHESSPAAGRGLKGVMADDDT
jgi:hypothetical protein